MNDCEVMYCPVCGGEELELNPWHVDKIATPEDIYFCTDCGMDVSASELTFRIYIDDEE